MAIVTKELTESHWPAIEALFGGNGACGGCWCMAWRSPYSGKAYEERKGENNRADFRRLVTKGRAHGVLAFDGKGPVGWCSVGPRADFPALERSRVLQTEWDAGTWSVTCFFIRRTHRGCGVGTALLKKAIAVAKRHGAARLEGYPVRINPEKPPLPGPFAWTGVPSMFEAAGFTLITEPPARPIYTLQVS